MPTLSQKLREIEKAAQRLTRDRRQAVGLRKKIEGRLKQEAAKQARRPQSRQAALDAIQGLRDELVKAGRVGWVKFSGKKAAVLVERGTGCVITDERRSPILDQGVRLQSKPAINQAVFLQHLKSTFVENFVPYIYRDNKGNVTVGIGQLLPTVTDAKQLTFTRRGTSIKATQQEIENDFNNVNNANISLNSAWPEYRKLTSLEYSEQRAEQFAINHMNMTLTTLRSANFFPEFDTYPVLAKMGLLDLAYNAGASGARTEYKRTAAAILNRDWKRAGIEQRTARRPERADIVQAWFNRAAQQEPFFISHTNCKKPLRQLVRP